MPGGGVRCRGRPWSGERPPEGSDSAIPFGELANHLTTVQLAVDDMVRLANDLNVATSLDMTNGHVGTVRQSRPSTALALTVEKALEAADEHWFLHRKAQRERLLRDVHAQFHPLPTKRQQRFTGRMALGLGQSRTAHKDSARATYIMCAVLSHG